MIVAATTAVSLLFWWGAWPRLIALMFHHAWWKWLEAVRLPMCQSVGALIFICTAIIALFNTLMFRRVFGDDSLNSQAGAIALAAAVTFAYGTVMPPVFVPFFHRVTDERTGSHEPRHVPILTVRASSVVPMFVGITNAGIATWAGFRITVHFDDSSFLVSDDDPVSPGIASQWPWFTKVRVVARNVVQASRSDPLAAGEPQIMRFWITSPATSGTYPVRFVVAAAGRFGETFRTLHVSVV